MLHCLHPEAMIHNHFVWLALCLCFIFNIYCNNCNNNMYKTEIFEMGFNFNRCYGVFSASAAA
jgi:hypothetical protein